MGINTTRLVICLVYYNNKKLNSNINLINPNVKLFQRYWWKPTLRFKTIRFVLNNIQINSPLAINCALPPKEKTFVKWVKYKTQIFGFNFIHSCHFSHVLIKEFGGPIFVNGVQVGIASYGKDCSDLSYSRIYTRLTTYLTWIKTTVTSNPGPASG